MSSRDDKIIEGLQTLRESLLHSPELHEGHLQQINDLVVNLQQPPELPTTLLTDKQAKIMGEEIGNQLGNRMQESIKSFLDLANTERGTQTGSRNIIYHIGRAIERMGDHVGVRLEETFKNFLKDSNRNRQTRGDAENIIERICDSIREGLSKLKIGGS